MRLAVLLLATALGATGCAQFEAFKDFATSFGGLLGGVDNAEPARELEPIEPTVDLTVLWKTSVGKGYDNQIVNLVPAVTSSTVYVADRKGLIEAHNRQDGDTLWSVSTRLELSAGPVVAGDKLLFGTSNAELIAISLADGALLWKTMLSSEILALPKASHNITVVRTSDGRLAGLDLGTGAVKWSHDRSIPPLSVRSLGSPTIHDDVVLDGFGSGKLIALGLTDGKPAWETTVAIPRGRSEVERLVELDAEPLVKDDVVYITGVQGGVTAVNLTDGDIQWRQTTVSSSHGLTAGRRSLFISDAKSDVWQIDLSSGRDLWKQDALHQRQLTVPALIRDRLVVGDFEGYLHVLAADDGHLVGRLQIDDEPIRAQPVIHDETLFVYTSGGVLAALGIN